MSQFYKTKGWLFQLLFFVFTIIILILSFTFMTRYVDAHDHVESSVEFRNFLRWINDLIFYLGVIALVILTFLTILNVYKRRHFKKFHLITGIIATIIPFVLAVIIIVLNASSIPLFYENLEYLYEWHDVMNMPRNAIFEASSITLYTTIIIMVLFLVTLGANVFYFINRYRTDEKNVRVGA